MHENVPKPEGVSRCVQKLPNSYLPEIFLSTSNSSVASLWESEYLPKSGICEPVKA